MELVVQVYSTNTLVKLEKLDNGTLFTPSNTVEFEPTNGVFWKIA